MIQLEVPLDEQQFITWDKVPKSVKKSQCRVNHWIRWKKNGIDKFVCLDHLQQSLFIKEVLQEAGYTEKTLDI